MSEPNARDKEIEKIRIRAEAIIRSSAGGSGNTKRAMDILDSLVRLAVINEGLIKDRKAKNTVPIAMLREISDDGEYTHPDTELRDIAARYGYEVTE